MQQGPRQGLHRTQAKLHYLRLQTDRNVTGPVSRGAAPEPFRSASICSSSCLWKVSSKYLHPHAALPASGLLSVDRSRRYG